MKNVGLKYFNMTVIIVNKIPPPPPQKKPPKKQKTMGVKYLIVKKNEKKIKRWHFCIKHGYGESDLGYVTFSA